MKCPKCASKTKVTCVVTEIKVTRFRKCTKCKYNFKTFEVIEVNNYSKKYAIDTFEEVKKTK